MWSVGGNLPQDFFSLSCSKVGEVEEEGRTAGKGEELIRKDEAFAKGG